MAGLPVVVTKTIADCVARYGKQIGKVSNKGIAAFETPSNFSKCLTLVNVNTGKKVGTHAVIDVLDKDFRAGRRYLNYNAKGDLVSKGSIMTSQYKIPYNMGFDRSKYADFCYSPQCTKTPTLDMEYMKWNKFGQKIYEKNTNISLSAKNPEMTITSQVNGGETTTRTINTEFMA